MAEQRINGNPSDTSILGELDSGPWLLPITVTTIAICMIAYWVLPVKTDQRAIYAICAVGAWVGIIIGMRHSSTEHKNVLRPALNTGFRLGIIWIVIAGIVEYVLTDQTSSHTADNFPAVIIPLITVTVIVFCLSHYITLYVQRILKINIPDRLLGIFLNLTGIVVSLIGIAIAVYGLSSGDLSLDGKRQLLLLEGLKSLQEQLDQLNQPDLQKQLEQLE